MKRTAVDDVVRQVIGGLKSPRKFVQQEVLGSSIQAKAISNWLADQMRNQQVRSEWYLRLTDDERAMLSEIVEEATELAAFSFMTLIDGVGSEFEGVFEIAAIDGDDSRTVLNPENSEMLHDLLSEICEEDRRNG